MDLVRSLECSDENLSNQRCFEASVRDLPEEFQSRATYTPGTAVSQLASLRRAGVLIVDPPRRGLDSQVVEALASRAATPRLNLLLYVSCGFRAMQRDTTMLRGAGWMVSHAEGHVLFP